MNHQPSHSGGLGLKLFVCERLKNPMGFLWYSMQHIFIARWWKYTTRHREIPKFYSRPYSIPKLSNLSIFIWLIITARRNSLLRGLVWYYCRTMPRTVETIIFAPELNERVFPGKAVRFEWFNPRHSIRLKRIVAWTPWNNNRGQFDDTLAQ